MQSLAEKYRPRTWDEVLGQGKAVKSLLGIRKRGGFGGHAYWITGASGIGKTTIARLIAREIVHESEIKEIDARDCTIGLVQGIADTFKLASRSLFPVSVVFIINEADDLRADVLARFKTALEPIPPHCAIIFTCTKESAQELLWEDEDAPQFLSRCIPVPLTSRGLKEIFAKRLHYVANIEGLNGKDLKWYERLMMDERNNLRGGYGKIEAGAAMAD